MHLIAMMVMYKVMLMVVATCVAMVMFLWMRVDAM